MLSWKFAAYFENIFFLEHLWVAASGWYNLINLTQSN